MFEMRLSKCQQLHQRKTTERRDFRMGIMVGGAQEPIVVVTSPPVQTPISYWEPDGERGGEQSAGQIQKAV